MQVNLFRCVFQILRCLNTCSALTWDLNKDFDMFPSALYFHKFLQFSVLLWINIAGYISMSFTLLKITLQLLNCDAAVFTECRMLPGLVWLTATQAHDYTGSSVWTISTKACAGGDMSPFFFIIRDAKGRARSRKCAVPGADSR